jgi:signal transduction histidine kinase
MMGSGYTTTTYQTSFSWARLGLLALSFCALIAFSIQFFRLPTRLAAVDILIGVGFLVLYVSMLLVLRATVYFETAGFEYVADVLARYFLAIPGSILASIALWRQGQDMDQNQREALTRYFHWTALGFLLYGFTQVFTPSAHIFPANVLNSAVFLKVTGIPIQAFRALFAIIITVSLIQLIKAAEQERQAELDEARQARLDALQRAQEETIKRVRIRRDLLRRLVQNQEEDRARISRELHDETAQTVTAFNTNLAALQYHLPKSPQAKEIMERLHQHCDKIARDLHRLVHDLHPAQLDMLGLAPALQFLADQTRESFNLHISLDIVGEPNRLDPLHEVVVYRIAQEALTNIVRHANVHAAEVRLCFEAQVLQLYIHDKGVGFDPDNTISRSNGMGLVGMRERVEAVGGTFLVKSQKGQGTTIEAEIPYSRDSLVQEKEGNRGNDSRNTGR